MKNAKQLRDELAAVFDKLKSGELKAHEAAEFANLGGKMISSAKVQLEYYAQRQEVPDIAFLKEEQEGG